MAKNHYGIDLIAVDLDSAKYKACMAAESKYNYNKELGQPPSFAKAVMCLNTFLRGQEKYLHSILGTDKKPFSWRKWQEEGKVKFYISSLDKSNFRYKVATIKPYKANRPPRPLLMDKMQEWLKRKWGAEEVSGMEADDAIGIESAKDPQHTLIWHEDKDLWQLEGWHGWFEAGRALGVDTKHFYSTHYKGDLTLINTRRLMYVSNPGMYWLERSASGALELFSTGQYRLAQQMIQGDSSDNIPKIVKEVKGGREFGYGDMEIFEMFNSWKCVDDTVPGDHPERRRLELLVSTLFDNHYRESPCQSIHRMQEIERLVTILTSPREEREVIRTTPL